METLSEELVERSFYEHVLSTEYYEKLNQNKGDDSDWMTYQPPIDRW